MAEIPIPSLPVLCRLGSIAVHAEELLSPEGNDFDRTAINALLSDEEVRKWLSAMDELALLPLKRERWHQTEVDIKEAP